MHIILLSGGSGKRLWPLSNSTRSKQFLEIIPNNDGYESMIQRTCRQLNSVLGDYDLSVSTTSDQRAILEKQLKDIKSNINIICEPSRRNTFPAVMLSTADLVFNKNINLNEKVIFSPVDLLTSSAFFDKFLNLSEKIDSDENTKFCLLGIRPTYPSEKYGYILNNNSVTTFTEKPDVGIATDLIHDGALWNSGVFCTKLKYLKEILDTYKKFNSYKDVCDYYDYFDAKSFDYIVLEKEKKLSVVPYNGEWKDLGTWNTFTDEIDMINGRVIMGEGCKNTNILNELHIPIIALGLKNTIIAASPDGILVSDKSSSVNLGNYVSQIPDRIKYEERVWGRYTVLDESSNRLVKSLFIDSGKNLSYQRHMFRDEVWTVVSGDGIFVLDDEVKNVSPGDVLFIPKKSKHAIKAINDIEILEVQLGSNFVEEDIERFEFNWNNVNCKQRVKKR